MKKMISMLTALALVLSLCLIPTCSAYGRENTKVVDLGNGITVETTTTVTIRFCAVPHKRRPLPVSLKITVN